MEALAIVHPETNTPLGIMPRAAAIKEGAWCRSTNVYVMNNRGEILCHQRSLQKERMPGVWCTHLGGHVGCDESYESNALKELTEEAGVSIAPSELVPWRTTKIDKARLWVREYVTLIDKPVQEFTPQPGEVDRFAWLSPQDIIKEAEDHPEIWCAGTHNFMVEYHCLKAALTVAHAQGQLSTSVDLHTWHPIQT